MALKDMDCQAQPGLLGTPAGSNQGGHAAVPRSLSTNPVAGATWNALGPADAGPVQGSEGQAPPIQFGPAHGGEGSGGIFHSATP